MTNKVTVTKEYLTNLFNSGKKIEEIAEQMSADLETKVSVKEAKDAFTKLGLDLRKKPRTTKIEWVIEDNEVSSFEEKYPLGIDPYAEDIN